MPLRGCAGDDKAYSLVDLVSFLPFTDKLWIWSKRIRELEDSDGPVAEAKPKTVRLPNPFFQPEPCRKCHEQATRVSSTPAGGQRYRCRSCKRTFIVGGPGRGRRIPGPVAMEAARLLQEEGLSIRATCRITGINKRTGRALARRLEAARHTAAMRAIRIGEIPHCDQARDGSQ